MLPSMYDLKPTCSCEYMSVGTVCIQTLVSQHVMNMGRQVYQLHVSVDLVSSRIAECTGTSSAAAWRHLACGEEHQKSARKGEETWVRMDFIAISGLNSRNSWTGCFAHHMASKKVESVPWSAEEQQLMDEMQQAQRSRHLWKSM